MCANRNEDSVKPQSDLPQYLGRRRVLALIAGGVSASVIAACSADSSSSKKTVVSSPTTTDAPTDSTDVATAENCDPIPEETSGPYPGDGSNGPDVLAIDGVERRDIRSSIGSASGTASGTQLTVDLTIVDAATCAPLAGAAVYLWHADSQGRYSMYSSGVSDENFLRGVQVADASGKLSFVSVYPGCYDGRWPHIHFEVYATAADVGTRRPLVTSQLAFPRDTCEVAYAATGYESSAGNLSRVSLDSDMVFRDGADQQMATMTGDVNGGFTASLTVVV